VSLSTPVLLIIFNRPDLTERVFGAIAKAKPRQLFVAADGPRFPQEAEKCSKARAVLERVDWDCEVYTDFSVANLGCGRREASAFDWVFSQVEEAILLEDDTLPAPSFFRFCQVLLERYRYDERIMMISGNNFQSGPCRTDYSYYFSKLVSCWGWAGWRRAWKYYDFDMRTWPEFKKQKLIELVCEDRYQQKVWTDIFDQMFVHNIDTWDYQWVYACWSQSGLAVLPTRNLVTNIGFRPDATHTKGRSPVAELPTCDIWDVKHPPFVVRDRVADKRDFDTFFGPKRARLREAVPAWIRQHLATMRGKRKPWL
jgi:hypothetical protein